MALTPETPAPLSLSSPTLAKTRPELRSGPTCPSGWRASGERASSQLAAYPSILSGLYKYFCMYMSMYVFFWVLFCVVMERE